MSHSPSIRIFQCALLAMINVQLHATDVMSLSWDPVAASPLTKEVIETRYATELSLVIEEEMGPIVELEPLVISPIITSTEQLITDLKRDPDQFLTGVGWRKNMGYRSDIDAYLNLFSIPFFGISQEAIAFMYAKDAKLEKKLKTLDLIRKTRTLHGRSSDDNYSRDRYELMRIKRTALFGSSWAIPEIGK